MQDRSRVVGGPDLEQQRQAFAAAFVRRPSFLNDYPLTLTNEQFVNRMFDKANLTPFTAERQAEIQAIYSAGGAGKCVPILVAPILISQPTNQTVVAGGAGAFSVLAMGTPPF